jgi:hypothetical protein
MAGEVPAIIKTKAAAVALSTKADFLLLNIFIYLLLSFNLYLFDAQNHKKVTAQTRYFYFLNLIFIASLLRPLFEKKAAGRKPVNQKHIY